MRRLSVFVTCLMLAIPFAGAAHAQEIEAGIETDVSSRDDWRVQFGAAGILRSDFPGAESVQGMVVPFFDITYKDKYFLSPVRGAGVFFHNDRFNFTSVAVNFSPGRDEDEAGFLTGLGDVDGGAAVQLAAQRRLGYLVVGGNLSYAFTGDATGTELDAYISTRVPVSERLRIYPGIQATFADGDRQEAFFGVTATQAANSAFSAYEADAGLQSYGLQAQAFYRLSNTWQLIGIGSWEVLTGDAADSPITQDENQFFFVFGAVRAF